MASLKKKIEDEHDRQLTTRQMTFARHIVEGIYSNAEAARKAGYSHDIARKQASILLNGRDYPHVLEYVTELRAERERRYAVTTIGQLQRLHQLSQGAEEAGQECHASTILENLIDAEYKDVTDEQGARGELLEHVKKSSAKKDTGNKD